MILAFKIIAMLAMLTAAAGGVLIVVAAFRDTFAQGLLCVFLPFYIVLYGLFWYEGPRRLAVQFLFFGGLLIGVGMYMLAATANPADPIFR